MNLYSMDYFSTLARERSFTRAADQLHITQQSLSAHIASLERELGCPLLIRHIPLELTYAGEVFLRYAEEFCQAHDAMLREFSDITQNQRGVLRVGVAPARGRCLLPTAITRFQQLFPNICVALTEGANDALCQLLLKGELDLAIADFPPTVTDITTARFYQEETLLFIPRTLFHRIYGDDAMRCEEALRSGDFSPLDRCPLVLGSMEDVDGRIAMNILKRAGIKRPLTRAVSHNVATLMSLCAADVGACFCPDNLARAMLTPDQYAQLMAFHLGDDAGTWIRFGYPSNSYQWSVIEAFMDCAQESLHTIAADAR